MSDIKHFDQNQRRSRAIVHNGIVYTAGHVADDLTLDVTGQAKQVLAKLEAILKEAGADKSRLLTAQVWLSTMDDFAAFNAVWDAWVVPGSTPTRCCGKVEMANPKYRVEIVLTAAI